MKTSIALFLTTLALLSICSAQENANLSCHLYDTNGQLLPPNATGYYPCSNEGWPTPFSAADPLNMVQIGTLVAPMYNTMTGGDSDGDSLFEAYMYIKDNVPTWTFTYRIYESNGQNVYNQVFAAAEGLIPYAFGDQDNDGLAEVIGQWSSWVYVWESPSPGRLATQMVWQSPPVVNVTGYTAIGDLDEDNLGEIIHTSNSFGNDNRLIIWENTGNNQFQEIYNQWISNGNIGTKAIADFDGDGLTEIAFTSGNGDVYVFESNGNNSLQQIYRGSMNTWNSYACTYANDMDGNSHPEFVSSGSDGNQGWVNQIYEAVGNDSFVVRQTITLWDGYFGVPGNTVGDFDNDGIDEFVIQTAQALHLYKWNGQTYAEVQNIPENFGSILHGVFAYDGDHDSYDELFWLGIGDGGYWTNETILLENEFPGPLPYVTIQITPLNPPIIIPTSGGTFDFNVVLTNNDSLPRTFGTWVMVILPAGQWYGPVISVGGITLPAGATITRIRTQAVPGTAPGGPYAYIGYVGEYPNTVYDSSYFSFTKSGAGDWGLGAGEWLNTGEDFKIAEVGAQRAAPLQPEIFSVSIYPSPFNPTTTISFELRATSTVRLEVFDVNGRFVGAGLRPAPTEAWYPAGAYQITFDGSGLPSGIYFYRLVTEEQTAVGKMMLMK